MTIDTIPPTGTLGHMSTFATYCDAEPHGVQRRIARLSGVSKGTVNRAYKGHAVTARVAKRISAATGGAVSVEVLQKGTVTP